MLSCKGITKEEAHFKLRVLEKGNDHKKELNVLKIFDDIVNNRSPVLETRMKFINILRGTSEYSIILDDNEKNWMIHNLDLIANIIHSKKAIMIMWCLYRQKESYIQEIARCCRSYTTPIKYWINVFENCWLVESRRTSFGKRKIFYHLNYENYPNIIETFLELLRNKHNEEYLDSLVIPNRKNDGTIIDLQKDALYKARKKRLY